MYGLRYKVIDRNDRIVVKEKWFRTTAAREKWIDTQAEKNDNWFGTDSTCDDTDGTTDPRHDENWR